MNSAVTLERVERLPERVRELLRSYYIPVLPEQGRALCRQTMGATAAIGWACFL